MQQGERRGGKDAIPHLQRAVELFQDAFKGELTAEERQSGRVLCAEALQRWAQQVLEAEATLPDSEQSAGVLHAAQQTATQLLRRAVQVPHRTAVLLV